MAKLTIAKHSSAKIINIRDAANGLACDCTCSYCGDRLIARQGEIKDWSFAHESGAECAGALETVLHKSAIQLITDEKRLYIGEYDPISSSPRKLPKYYLEDFYNRHKKANPKSTLSEIEYFSNKELAIKVFNAKQQCMKSRITFSEAYSERRAEGSTRKPDVTAIYKGIKIYVEIVVTHKCDEEKISDLKVLDVLTIQINISSLLRKDLSLEIIRDAIFNLTPSPRNAVIREWLVKPKYMQEADELARQYFDMAMNKVQALENEEKEQLAEKRARQKIITIRGIEMHIDQRETWGTIWMRQYSKQDDTIELVLKELKAERKLPKFIWTVQEGKILEKIQSIQERIAIEEKIELDKQVAYRRESDEKARNKLEDYIKQRKEEDRLRKIEDEIREAKLAEEEKAHAEQELLRKAREEEIIAEVKKKHQGTVNYQFRLKKIIEELKAQGIKYR